MEVGGISLPIALGLLVMMYPPLAKVRYDKTREITSDKRLMSVSLLLNWLVGPALMFALAWTFLPDEPELRTGLIIVGLARCIAMVLVWSDMSCGDREATAVLVAVNSVFQVLMFGVLGWFYLQVLPSWLGLETTSAEFSFWAIVTSVLVFLGIPLLAGVLSRIIGEKAKGRTWYESKFIPAISPLALIGLLYTVVLLFSLQGEAITSNPWAVARLAVPLLIYSSACSPSPGRLQGLGHELRTVGFRVVHRRGQQLRAGHRRVHRHLRCDLRSGAGRHHRPAHRDPRAGGPGLRHAVGRSETLPE